MTYQQEFHMNRAYKQCKTTQKTGFLPVYAHLHRTYNSIYVFGNDLNNTHYNKQCAKVKAGLKSGLFYCSKVFYICFTEVKISLN